MSKASARPARSTRRLRRSRRKPTANTHCGYNGARWEHDLEQHFRWCRHIRREAVITEVRERAGELQRCFNQLGDFDEEATELSPLTA